MKFVPVTVKFKSGLPATTVAGESELIDSGPGGGLATIKVNEFDFVRGMSPIGSPVSTSTCTMPAIFNNAAGATAVSRLLLLKVVAKRVSEPFADHATLLTLCAALAKFDPVTVNLRSGLPAAAFVGEIELIDTPDGGGGD